MYIYTLLRIYLYIYMCLCIYIESLGSVAFQVTRETIAHVAMQALRLESMPTPTRAAGLRSFPEVSGPSEPWSRIPSVTDIRHRPHANRLIVGLIMTHVRLSYSGPDARSPQTSSASDSEPPRACVSPVFFCDATGSWTSDFYTSPRSPCGPVG